MAVDSNVPERVACASALAAARRAHGLTPVKADDVLNQVTQAFVDDLATQGYFAHRDRRGRWPWDRMAEAGYNWAEAGEVLAWGQTGGLEVVRDWLASPGHRAQILHPTYTQFGVGCATGRGGRLYWAIDLARPRIDRPATQVRSTIVTDLLASWCAAAAEGE